MGLSVLFAPSPSGPYLLVYLFIGRGTGEIISDRPDVRAVFIRVSKSNWFCVCYATQLA